MGFASLVARLKHMKGSEPAGRGSKHPRIHHPCQPRGAQGLHKEEEGGKCLSHPCPLRVLTPPKIFHCPQLGHLMKNDIRAGAGLS